MISPLDMRARQCHRYDKEGVRCRRVTARADRWCGECAGHSTPQRRARDDEEMRRHYGWFAAARTLPAASPPIGVDEAYEVPVTITARQTYADIHGMDTTAAETQLRSLLEDLLLQGECRLASGGVHFVYLDRQGYGLILSPDHAVIGYRTKHQERTWPQVRAGVSSRSTDSRSARRAASAHQVLDLLGDAPVRVTVNAARQYASRSLNTSLKTPEAATRTAAALAALLTEVHERWTARPHEHHVLMPDGSHWTIVAADDEDAPPVLVRFEAPAHAPEAAQG